MLIKQPLAFRYPSMKSTLERGVRPVFSAMFSEFYRLSAVMITFYKQF